MPIKFSATEKTKLTIGLLMMRVGLGVVFIFHGYPKLFGGVERWARVGEAMSNVGIDSYHTVFGFLAGFAEFFGGIFLIFGLFTLPALLLLISTMFIAMITQISRESGFSGIAHPLSMGIVFLSLLFTGPGRYSLDYKFRRH